MSYALDSSPRLPPRGSPSRQLLLEIARDLEQVHIYASDIKTAKAYERASFYNDLDRIDVDRAAEHNAALDEVAADHSRVREQAEDTLRKHLIAEEERRVHKEEEARRERERIERDRIDRQHREQEEAIRREAERKAKEEAKRKAEAEAEKARKTAEEERKRKDEEEKRKQEESEKAEREATERQAREAQVTSLKQPGLNRQTEEEMRIHRRYIELHQYLKKFRQWIKDEGKKNPIVKQNAGDIRRSIKKCVGQLREGRGANKAQLQEIKATLDKAAAVAEPAVDIRHFFAFPPEHITSSDDTKVSALLIYGFNIFVKSIISALIIEASLNPAHAEPIGIIAAHIFSADSFIYRGLPLSDILWAKYRVVCPALWGFYGDQKTPEGRRALGWWRDDDGHFVPEQRHVDRMTALGAGFSALTLRNFSKTARRNPFPNTIFWHAMHKILSIPLREVQETHITLLTAALRTSAERIITFFGTPGLVLLRRAIVDIPASRTEQTMAVHELKLLRELCRRDKNILL